MPTEYEIRIPGAKQIFRLGPPPDISEGAKRAIIKRAQERSPLPGFLQWVPRVINVLDDAQDILITGLTLAKPLLRRLPLRFVPVLGWVLLANDVLNISTAILATGIGGAFPKKIAKNVMQFYSKVRFNPTGGTKAFFGGTGKLSFALQAAQASQTITGYGLSLGGIMGLITDSFWGVVRTLQGNKVTIKGPPPKDIFGKAARFLSQTFGWDWSAKILTKEQEMTVLCAQKIAIDMIAEDSESGDKVFRMKQADDIIVPNVIPHNETSRRALIAEGVDPDVDQLPLASIDDINATFGDVVRGASINEFKRQIDLKNLYGETEEGVFNQCIRDEAGIQTMEWLKPEGRVFEYEFDFVQKFVLAAFEFGIMPAKIPSVPKTVFGTLPEPYVFIGTTVRGGRTLNRFSLKTGDPTVLTSFEVRRIALTAKRLMGGQGLTSLTKEIVKDAMFDLRHKIGYIDIAPSPRSPSDPVASPVRL